MAASSTQYGSYQPNAVDPYPIESVLAPLAVGNNPANAANMLDEYQMQRMTDAGNYQYAANQQHDFAKQQLAQQLQEQYLKSALDAVQHRGGVSAYNQIVGPEHALSADLTSGVEGGLTGLQNAKILEQSGSGAKSAAEAGRDITDEQAARASNGLLGPYGTPLSTRNILIKEANANARHAGGGGAGDFKLNAQLPADPNSGLILSGSIPKGWTIPQYEAALKAKGYQGNLGRPGALSTGDGTTPTPAGPGASSSVAPRSTPLTPAPQPRAASTPAPQNGANIRAAAEKYVENNLRISNPAAYKDAVAGKVGGKLNVQQGPDGRPYIQGKEGRH
jgi:hypothetical protein